MQTPDLLDILQQKTEQKVNSKVDFNDFEQAETIADDTAQPNTDDFEEAKIEEPVIEEPKIKEAFAGFTEPLKAEKPRLTESEYAKSALMYIALFDGIQTLTLPWLYQKSAFTKEEKKQLKIIQTKQKEAGSSGEVSYTNDDLKILQKYNAIEELNAAVPYTPDEIEFLKNPLAAVFSKHNIQPGPEFALISAAIAVSLPRLIPLFSRFER